jgi:ATP-binding cassette, subfamily B, bacterial PglK
VLAAPVSRRPRVSRVRPPRLFLQLRSLLSAGQRKQAVRLLAALIVRAAFQLVGVASLGPFMSIVSDPGVIHRNPTLREVYARGGFGSDSAFLLAFGVGIVVLLTVSNGVSALATWTLQRFVWNANDQLSRRLLRGYLAQPYGFFVQQNSASLHKNILSEVQSAVSGVLMPTLNGVAQGLVVLALAGMLVVVDPLLAATIVLVLGGAYGFIFLGVRRKQKRLGRVRLDANRARYIVAGEAFGGIKDVKVLQREDAFVDRFEPPSRQFSMAMASNAAIAQLPLYLMETLAFGGIVLTMLYYLRAGQGATQILPTVSLYAFAGYRLLPAVQTLFAAAASVRFNRAALDHLCEDLARFDGDLPERSPVPAPLAFRDAIRFEDVVFRYPNTLAPALREISLTIARNETVGLVGASGSGKTTLADLLLGLYTPESGRILVDGAPLDTGRIPAWRRQVGYVPQQIFLCDASIAQNIAFGIPAKDVDQRQVERAARSAQLHDFVMTLPDGYDTVVGERGVRLSGGQRQRIGIARALYHDPAVLVMDEATSALDGATEGAVMDAIHSLGGHKTIVLIAHRLSTVRDCDRIFLFEHGCLQDQGTFAELAASSRAFRRMAKLDAAVGDDSARSVRRTVGGGAP